MPFLVAATVILTAVTLLNLALTLGIVRRLREHSQRLADATTSLPDYMLLAGQPYGDFLAQTVTGERIDESALEPDTLVGFFSPSCGTCALDLPRFRKLAERHPGGRDRVLAVVVGEPHESAHAVGQLAEVSRVVVAPHGDNEVESAFAVRGFPTYCLTGDAGTVAVSGSLDVIRHVRAVA